MALLRCDTFYHKSVMVANVLARVATFVAECDWPQSCSSKNLSKSTKGIYQAESIP